MKYEIIKGSEKDFEGCNDGVMRIYRSDSGSFLYADIDTFDARWELIAERRPITEPIWDGEGLPPVGVECEIKRVADWFPVTIKFISGYYTVILTRGGTEDAFQTSALQFRPIPIRSPEDVARDESALDLFLTINFNDTEADWVALGARRNDYYKAIDAGYRKME